MRTNSALLVAIAVTATACAATDRDVFIEQGATKLGGAEIVDLVKGNSLQGADFVSYYSDDGAKIVKLGNGSTVYRTWRVADDGSFCETLVRNNREVCESNYYALDGEHKAFRPNGGSIDFDVVNGNRVGIRRLTGEEVEAVFTSAREDFKGVNNPGVTAVGEWSPEGQLVARWKSRNNSGEVNGQLFIENNMRCITFEQDLDPNPECTWVFTTDKDDTFVSVLPNGKVHGTHAISPLN